MTSLVVVLAVVALAGWLVAGALYRSLHYALIREHALDGGNRALQKMFDDAADEARYYREAVKVKDIHIAWLEAKKEEA